MSPEAAPADEQLMQAYAAGDARAFEILYDRHHLRLWRYVYRSIGEPASADELAQEVWFSVARAGPRYAPSAAAPDRPVARFSTWLFRIAANDCIDHIRRQKTRKETSLELISEYGFDPADPRDESVDERLIEAADHQMVRLAIRQLDADQKMVLVMKVYEEMTFEDIAAALALPLSTVKSRLYKALEHVGRQVRRRQLIERIGT